MRTLKFSMVFAGFLFLVGCGASSPSPESSPLPTVSPSPVATVSPTPAPTAETKSPTTGLPTEQLSTLSLSVMIENSPDARPHTGLSQADIVYEMKTEGEISRYMALFRDQIPEKIGPVRSARHYFVPLAQEWNIPYIHYGGSWYAYQALEKVSIPVIDGIKTSAQYFIRDASRKAPHNAYLIPSKLTLEPSALTDHFTFKSENDYISSSPVHTLSLSYNNFTDIRYEYVTELKSYQRFQEEKAQVDLLNNQQITVQNIVVLTAEHKPVPNDPKGRIDIALVGSGKLSLFRDGVQIDGTWSKSSETDPMQFVDASGTPLFLHPGKTWIQIIEPTQAISVK